MTVSNAYFSESQLELMTCILDCIVPPQGKMPGAGTVALAYLDRVVGARGDYKRLFGDGLVEIENAARAAYGREFTELSEDERDGVLRHVEAGKPAFFQTVVRDTYMGYYSNPLVVELLGLEVRPPQPRGHQLELGDLSALENVKQRGAVWRETGD